MIITDILRALSQLGDPRFSRVLKLGIALTLALLFAAYGGWLWLTDAVIPGTLDLPGVGPVTWVGDLFRWGSLFFLAFVSMFLMVPVASAITSLFLDDVADAVEARFYPWLGPPLHYGLWTATRDTAAHLAVVIVANGLALFVYLALPLTIPVLFLALNGFLLGREYFFQAAMRRLGRSGARALARRHPAQIWLAGMAMALPLAVPVVNLLVPVLGAAAFTHMVHRLSGDQLTGVRAMR